MNAPLPDHIRKSPETVMLDEKPRTGFHRRYQYAGLEADRAVIVFKHYGKGVAA